MLASAVSKEIDGFFLRGVTLCSIVRDRLVDPVCCGGVNKHRFLFVFLFRVAFSLRSHTECVLVS
jgi:hypothetical protein